MAKKADLSLLINTNLADLSDIEAVKHREVEDALVDELFSGFFIDHTDLYGLGYSILTRRWAGTTHRISISKVGDTVFMSGWFKLPEAKPAGKVFTIEDSLYFAHDESLCFSTARAIGGVTGAIPKLLQVDVTEIRSLEDIQADQTIYFNLTYKTYP